MLKLKHMRGIRRALTAGLMAVIAPAAFADVGGGATIHNAATLTFSGGQVTATVDVTVDTLASTPVFTVDQNNIDVFAGDDAVYTYTITNTSNGADTFSVAIATAESGVSEVGGEVVTPVSVDLGASVTSLDSDAAGNVFIPAGSETDLVVGDTIVVNLGGVDHIYTIASVTPGTAASTSGTVTTAETPTQLTLTPVGTAPTVGVGTIPAGTQIGEQQTLTATVTAGTPTTSGVNGTHTITLSGATTATDGTAVVNYTDGLNATTTVLSGDGELYKQVRNVTTGGTFPADATTATTGVTAVTGNVLEYRLTAASLPGITLNNALIEDTVPLYTQYVDGTTTLNGNPVADAGATNFPLDEGGLQVNSPSGAAGVVVDGETAVIIFQVTVD